MFAKLRELGECQSCSDRIDDRQLVGHLSAHGDYDLLGSLRVAALNDERGGRFGLAMEFGTFHVSLMI
jgi:hypothetical protein